MITLEESDRIRLEALYLRLELFQREISRLFQERDALTGEISLFLENLLQKEGITADAASIRPMFENFRLLGLEVPGKPLDTKTEKEDTCANDTPKACQESEVEHE